MLVSHTFWLKFKFKFNLDLNLNLVETQFSFSVVITNNKNVLFYVIVNVMFSCSLGKYCNCYNYKPINWLPLLLL